MQTHAVVTFGAFNLVQGKLDCKILSAYSSLTNFNP